MLAGLFEKNSGEFQRVPNRPIFGPKAWAIVHGFEADFG